MFTLDFEKPIHIHFIGIGGISMSGLAELLMKRGFTVSGSDRQESDLFMDAGRRHKTPRSETKDFTPHNKKQ